MNNREVEIVGASGHGMAMTINLLGIMWNRKSNLFFAVFHTVAAGIHAYALYTHVRRAREENGQQK